MENINMEMEMELSSDGSDFMGFERTQNLFGEYSDESLSTDSADFEKLKQNVFDATNPFKIIKTTFDYGKLIPSTFAELQIKQLGLSLKQHVNLEQECALCHKKYKNLSAHTEKIHTIFFKKCPIAGCTATFIDNQRITNVICHIKANHPGNQLGF